MSPAPNPGSARGEGGSEAAFPPAGVCGQGGCPSLSWVAGVAQGPISPCGTSPSQPCCVLQAGRQVPARG